MSSARKRSLEVAAEAEPPARRSKVSHVLLENELQSLRSELEHERSLREIDARRAQQSKSRLERQIQFASEEAEDAKQLLEEVRSESEQHITHLRQKRKEALEELRECQAQLAEPPEEFDDSMSAQKIIQLESQLQARAEEVESLRQELDEAVETTRQVLEETPRKAKATQSADPVETSSPAPTAVMKELNKARIALAESERKCRQLKRKSDDWQVKAQQYVQQKETAVSAKHRVTMLDSEVKELRKEVEHRRATNERWEDFAKELGTLLKLSTTGAPPEVSTVMRYLQKQLIATKNLETQKGALEKDLEQSADMIVNLEKQVRDASTVKTRMERDAKSVQQQLEQAKQQGDTLRAQQQIWQREADSLRALVKTFDDMQPNQPPGAEAKGLELALSTARDEVKVVSRERDGLLKEMETAASKQQTLQKEHDRVRDKFTKIRDALMEERAKAEKAEARAIQAETQAGKGHFNPSMTRALHFEKNPLFDAMKERYQTEINSLKNKLEDVSGEKPAPMSQVASSKDKEVDPEKLHQRLKDTFKEQIGLFREGVYLITGYKVDMLLDKSTPYFKVRSVYGEREEDVLVFNWPKGVKQPKNLDLRGTDFAKSLSTTDAYQYLSRYDSMPGFMAATQLSLLDKCTFVAK